MVYSYLNSKKVIKDGIRALNEGDGRRADDPKRIVEILSDQFKSVFEKDNEEIPDMSSINERVSEIKSERGRYDWGEFANIDKEII
jgi:hypothetical protein